MLYQRCGVAVLTVTSRKSTPAPPQELLVGDQYRALPSRGWVIKCQKRVSDLTARSSVQAILSSPTNK